MRVVLRAFLVSVVLVSPAMAAPGDFHVIDGTVAFGGGETGGSSSASTTATTGQTVAEFLATDGNREFRNGNSRQMLAQSFSPTADTTVPYVELPLRWTNNPKGMLWVTLERDNGGAPSGRAEATSDRVDVTSMTNAYTWTRFTFSRAPRVSPATPSWLVLHSDIPLSGESFVLWRGIGGNVYPGGEMKSFNGTTWTAERFDGSFRAYGGTGMAAPAGAPGAPGLLVVKGDDGKSYFVDTRSVAAAERVPAVGERVSVAAREGSRADELTALAIERRSGGSNQREERGSRDWQRLHGKVQSVQGSQMKFTTDDGRALDVDISRVTAGVQRGLDPHEGVTIVGFGDPQSGRFRARFVQQDSSDPTRKAVVAVDEKAWQRVHGTVQRMSGTTLTLRADDNRTVSVDTAKVSPAVRDGLRQGDNVIVIGHFRGDQNTVAADYIQSDSGAARR